MKLISLNPPIIEKDNYQVTLTEQFEPDIIWFIKANDIKPGEKLHPKNGYFLGMYEIETK